MDDDKRQRVTEALRTATLPHTMATAVVPILKRTPEYEQALRERRSKAFLEAESLSIGRALAEVLTERLKNLDPEAGR